MSAGHVVDDAPAYNPKPIIVGFLLDGVLVTAFSAIGRASHGSDPFIGLWETAWTFLLALCIAWAASFAWRAPYAPWRTGLPVWALTVAGGLLFRYLGGGGVSWPFVLVTAGVLFVFLVGWRLIAQLILRRRRTA